jgi:hypothetical protein
MTAGKHERPLGYGQVTIEDAQVYRLPGLDRDGLIGSYRPVLAKIRVLELAPTTDGEVGAVVWRDDGTEPTPTEGMPLYTGERDDYAGDPANLQLVRLNGTAVVVHVLYYAAPDDEA